MRQLDTEVGDGCGNDILGSYMSEKYTTWAGHLYRFGRRFLGVVRDNSPIRFAGWAELRTATESRPHCDACHRRLTDLPTSKGIGPAIRGPTCGMDRQDVGLVTWPGRIEDCATSPRLNMAR